MSLLPLLSLLLLLLLLLLLKNYNYKYTYIPLMLLLFLLYNVTNNGNTLSNRCLEKTLDGTAELEIFPSPGSS